jgi:dephospho-CoA kinase
MPGHLIYVGLAGSLASGKDTVAEWLVKNKNFHHISTSDIVREVALKRYNSIERPVLYKTANQLRKQNGHGALTTEAIEKFEPIKNQYQGLVVSGFRALAEAQVIKEHGGLVIYVDAPAELRYKRMQSRERDKESRLDIDEFKRREATENGQVDPAFNISDIKKIADHIIINDDSLEEFESKISALFKNL